MVFVIIASVLCVLCLCYCFVKEIKRETFTGKKKYTRQSFDVAITSVLKHEYMIDKHIVRTLKVVTKGPTFTFSLMIYDEIERVAREHEAFFNGKVTEYIKPIDYPEDDRVGSKLRYSTDGVYKV